MRVRCVRSVTYRYIGAVKLDADSWKLVSERTRVCTTENRKRGEEDMIKEKENSEEREKILLHSGESKLDFFQSKKNCNNETCMIS